MSTFIVGSLLMIGVIAAVWYTVTHDLDCGGSCSSCGQACSHRQGKSLVERYRQDHPNIKHIER